MDCKERFEFLDTIGRDELGEVVRARPREGEVLVAIKQFDAWIRESGAGLETYSEALERLASMNLERTPAIIGSHLDQTHAWLATRWVEGTTLASLIEGDRKVSPEDALAFSCGILLALEELHEQGEVHGGLTPRKVLFAGSVSARSVVVSDPGQYLLYAVSDPIRTSRAEPDRFLGLPEYFSPEQAQGKPPSAASDVYVAGLVLYELLVGKPPFQSSAKHTTLRRQIYEKPLPVRLASPGLDVPASLDEVLQRALSKEPEKRFATAGAFREALMAVRADAGVDVDDDVERAFAFEASGTPDPADADTSGAVPRVPGVQADEREQEAALPSSEALDGGEEDEDTSAGNEEQERGGKRRRKGKKSRKKRSTSHGEPVAAVAALSDERKPAEGAPPVEVAAASGDDQREKPEAAPAEDVGTKEGEAGSEEHAAWFSIGEDAERLKEHQTQRIILESKPEDPRKFQRGLVIGIALVIVASALVLFLVTGGSDSGDPGDADDALTQAHDVLAPPPGLATGVQEARDHEARDAEAAASENGEPEGEATPPEEALDTAAALVEAAMDSEETPAAQDAAPPEQDAADAPAEAAPVEPAEPPAPAVPEPARERQADAPRERERVREPAPAPEPAPQPEAQQPTQPRAEPETPAPSADAEQDARDQIRELLRSGRQALSNRDLAAARQQLEAALAINEGNAEAHALLGDVYFEERNYTAAARHHRRATRLSPRNAEYQRKLGMDFFRLGRIDNALEAFERAVELGDAGAEEFVRITRLRMED